MRERHQGPPATAGPSPAAETRGAGSIAVLLLGLLLALTPFSLPAGTVGAVDDRGTRVELAGAARRVVALAPFLTELVFAVGAGKSLVAVSKYSDYPPAARSLPRIGDAFSVNLEALLALRPDLVLSWQSGNDPQVWQRIESAGIPVFVLEPRVIADVPAALSRLGRLLGTGETAEARARQFTTSIAGIRDGYADRPDVRVFYQIAGKPLTTLNGRHMVTSVLALCGGSNVFGELAPVAPQVNRERVLARDPEAILISTSEAGFADQAGYWSRFPSLTASRAGNIFRVDPDLLNRQTPRLVQGARQVCRRLEQARRNLATVIESGS